MSEDLEERMRSVETATAVGEAVQAGAQATQAAAMSGMEATNAAATAGMTATNTAMQAGTWSTMGAGAGGFIIGIFLGLAIAAVRR